MNKIPALTDKPAFEQIHFVTGSVAFGCAKKSSDLDIAFLDVDREKVLSNPRIQAIQPSKYNSGVKYLSGETTINLIFLHPTDFIAWYLATEQISEEVLNEEIPDWL